MIGVYEMYIFREAATAPEGYIELDFLAGGNHRRYQLS